MKKTRVKWALLFLLFTLIAFFNTMRFITDELAEGNPGKLRFYFIMETTGAYTVLLLLPLVFWFFKKFPLEKTNLKSRIPLYFLGSVVFGLTHTSLMYLSRILIYAIAGLGVYDYGDFRYRVLMEYSNQFIVFWVIWIIIMFFKFQRKNQEQKVLSAQLQGQLTKAQLQALQTQLNPHFLFNTLNMISSTMYEDVGRADKMMADLSDLLRATLKENDISSHNLEKEMHLLDLYISIMKARFKNKLIVDTNVATETLLAEVPVFILQPLLENSIRHSMNVLDLVRIDVKIYKQKENLILQITDNGPGFSDTIDAKNQNGIGLSNVRARLEKMYGKDHLFEVSNLPMGGSQICMIIPFILQQK